MLEHNLIISLPTYPKFCWYATGTTHIFHLSPIKLKRITYQQHGTFSEHGHVAYQLKGITKCSGIVANFLPTDPPPPTTIGRRGQEVKI